MAATAATSVPSALPCALPGTPLAAARPGIDTCVHCGFCLQACPTYVNLEDENDSPRGRILLMRELVEGHLSPDDPAVHTHIDRCLGCRACETACPSGVPYGQLLEATRATLKEYHPIPAVARLILWVFARPRLLALALAGSRLARATGIPALLSRVGGRLGFAMGMLASTGRARGRRARYDAAGNGARGTTALLTGCVMEGLFAQTNRATERTLRSNDYAVVDAPGQRCCGALHAHAGDLDTARELARANVAAFERAGARYVAVNAAGCGAIMKEYAHLLADDPQWAERAAAFSARVRDVTELLAEHEPQAPRHPLPLRVAYHDACHLAHAQGVRVQPRALLRAIPELELLEPADWEICCGSAGIYNLVQPEAAAKLGVRKAANLVATGAEAVAAGNPGCALQIAAHLDGRSLPIYHPMTLLDHSIRGTRP